MVNSKPFILLGNLDDDIYSIGRSTVLLNSSNDIISNKRRINKQWGVLIPYVFFSLFPYMEVIIFL